MKTVLFIVLLMREPLLGAECPDTRKRSGEIGGDTISGFVSKGRKPLHHVPVRLYSGGKMIGTDQTDNEGRFAIYHVSEGKYALSVVGWGSTTVRINPDRDQPFLLQHPAWTISLLDRGCVGFGFSLD